MKKIISIVIFIWLAIVALSFIWNYSNARKERQKIAIQTAKSFFEKIVITREWNASHGGVYVPVNEKTKPNPYLEVPFREITVNRDLVLTKVNPAFMTRQIAETAAKYKGIQFHITSLKPIRPANKPTPLEKEALMAFEKGTGEVSAVIKQQPEDKFFYMAPLKTKKVCLNCHAKQGYKENDIRGGISVTIPFSSPIFLLSLFIGHLGIALVGIVGIVIFGKKLNFAYTSIQKQAIMDALTGIPNRRSFSETILKEYRRAQRERFPLSLIMCDIDKFKQYNDCYGHIKGDECLKKVACEIERTLHRSSDFCARYGGEEFVIILPNTPPEGAVHIAEKIRENVQSLKIKHEKSPPLGIVTLSMGVATIEEETNYITHEELTNRADQCLYKAKENGRNRVEFYQ